MAVDWIGFGYAAAIALGGFMGYKRKGERSHQVKLGCPTMVTIWLIINPDRGCVSLFDCRQRHVADGRPGLWWTICLWCTEH